MENLNGKEIINIDNYLDKDSEKLDNYFDKILKDAPDMKGIEELSVILSMPDDMFESIKPILLEEFEAGFNNSNDKYNLGLSFQNSEVSSSQLQETFQNLINSIDIEFKEYSVSKRDLLKRVFGMVVNSLEKSKGLHNRIIRIPIEICNEEAKIPTYAHDGDAGCDVYSLDDYTIEPNSTTLIPLGFKVAIPAGYELQIRPRSGMSLRTKIRVANAPGTIDSGYRGEVGVIVDNISDRPFYITKGMRIAQMVLSEVPVGSFFQVDNIETYVSERGKGGYGSSGE